MLFIRNTYLYVEGFFLNVVWFLVWFFGHNPKLKIQPERLQLFKTQDDNHNSPTSNHMKMKVTPAAFFLFLGITNMRDQDSKFYWKHSQRICFLDPSRTFIFENHSFHTHLDELRLALLIYNCTNFFHIQFIYAFEKKNGSRIRQ